MRFQSALLQSAVCAIALAASQACLATVTTLTLLPTPAENVVGNGATSAPGFSTGSWGGTGTGKSEVYIAAASLFSSVVTIRDIASISYWTNKTGAATDPDWTLLMYTTRLNDGKDSGGFYRSRLNAEPYYTSSGTVAPNTWHEWSTGDDAEDLRFYDAARSGNFGTYGDPHLSSLQAGAFTWGNNTQWDYSAETVSLFSLQTGSGWANGFLGLVDGLTITLKNGDVGIVNFEAVPGAAIPEPGTLALAGLALLAAGAARRRKA